jgi:hypothetical protein
VQTVTQWRIVWICSGDAFFWCYPQDMNDDTSRQVSPLPDTSRHTLSVDEAAALFVDAGVPKSVRTVQRYCRSGILESIRTDTEFGEKYLIDRSSVDRRIADLQKLQELMAATLVATRPDTSRHDGSRRDTSRNDATRRDNGDESMAPRVKELEEEVLNLKIDNRAKEIVINQLVGERKGFLSQITEQAGRIGELGATLRQLMAPRSAPEPETAEPVAVVPDTQAVPEREGDNHERGTGAMGVEL